MLRVRPRPQMGDGLVEERSCDNGGYLMRLRHNGYIRGEC